MGKLWDGQSLILGQIRGVPLGIHFTLLILAGVQEIYWIAVDGWWGIIKGVILILTLWLTVLIHELGHVHMCRRLGGEADRIILWPFGGLAYTKHSGDSSDRIKILLAGPFMHIPLGFTAFVFWFLFEDGSSLEWYCGWCCLTNLRLFAFNMFVPAHPLDGCSIFALWCLGSYSTDTTAKIFICLGIPYVVFLGWWGFAVPHFTAILLAFWLFAQTADLIIRVQQGPAGLAKHPMFTIADQMKPRKTQNNRGGIDVSNWDGSAQSWGGGPVGTAAVPVVGVPTTQQSAPPQSDNIVAGAVVHNPYVGDALKPDQQQGATTSGDGSPYVGGVDKPNSGGRQDEQSYSNYNNNPHQQRTGAAPGGDIEMGQMADHQQTRYPASGGSSPAGGVVTGVPPQHFNIADGESVGGATSNHSDHLGGGSSTN